MVKKMVELALSFRFHCYDSDFVDYATHVSSVWALDYCAAVRSFVAHSR